MPDTSETAHRALFVYRVMAIIAMIFGGIFVASLLRLFFGPAWYIKKPGKPIVDLWMRFVVVILGLKIHLSGGFSRQPSLIVANHVSWLDIIAIANVIPTRFVAKGEVSQWPVIGQLVSLSGTIFIKRNSISSMRKAVDLMARTINQEHYVAIFPEGTTTNGESTLPFHAGLLKAAISVNRPVQPVAIRYIRSGRLDDLAPFIDDDEFLNHLIRILKARQTCVELHICEPLAINNPVKQLAQESRSRIDSFLHQDYRLSA